MYKQTNLKKWEEMELVRRKLIPLWNLYIGEFFHDDKKIWKKRSEPYIFYKHLFRQFVYTKIPTQQRICDLEQEVTGTKPTGHTIKNSLNNDPNQFKLTQKELTEVLTFLNRYYNVNLQQHIKTKIMKAKNNGYLTEDIARHCRVHQQVVEDVLNNKNIPHYILKQMESELS